MYDDLGSQPYQDVPPQTPPAQEPSEGPKNNKKLIIGAILAIILVLVAALIFLGNSDSKTEPGDSDKEGQSLSGNGNCDAGEDCLSEPADCLCPRGTYCSNASGTCIEPTCGNEECEYYETPDTCCKDCGCWEGEICDPEANLCKAAEISLSEDEARILIEEHFASLGQTVANITFSSMFSSFENQPALNAMAYLNGEESFSTILVLENRTVMKIGH